MGKLTTTAIAAAGLALSGTVLLGCASPDSHARTHESAGAYVDDSVITTKVKAAILNEPSLKSFQIGVETYKNVVQLSGFVDSRHSARRAGEVAMSVKGVASVKNDLIVK
jgi:osmotically-inducible protein OsmY